MKNKILMIFSILLSTGIVNAQQQVSEKEAISVAVNTLHNKVEILKKSSETEIKTVHNFYNKNGDVLMYEVVFENGAAVLLSGSKACLPVLGYYIKPENDKGSIFDTLNENVPCGLQTLLYEYTQQIRWCFEQKSIELYYEKEWNELQNGSQNDTVFVHLINILININELELKKERRKI